MSLYEVASDHEDRIYFKARRSSSPDVEAIERLIKGTRAEAEALQPLSLNPTSPEELLAEDFDVDSYISDEDAEMHNVIWGRINQLQRNVGAAISVLLGGRGCRSDGTYALQGGKFLCSQIAPGGETLSFVIDTDGRLLTDLPAGPSTGQPSRSSETHAVFEAFYQHRS